LRAKELSALIQTDARNRLATLPRRGRPVPELEHCQECREIHIQSYRILYQPIETDRTVWILLVVHARRAIQDMLRRRLLQCPAHQ
jgi:plasmid stabilization system protein ParE